MVIIQQKINKSDFFFLFAMLAKKAISGAGKASPSVIQHLSYLNRTGNAFSIHYVERKAVRKRAMFSRFTLRGSRPQHQTRK